MKVALIEIGGSHDECLFTQILALHQNQIPVFMLTTQEVWDRNPAWHPMVSEIKCVSFVGKFGSDWKIWKLAIHDFKRFGVTHVVCNTAQGGQIRNLTFLLPRSMKMLGIIHTIRKFQGSFTQKVIHRRIRSYLLLSDFLREKIVPPTGIEVGVFYPIVYPKSELRFPKNPNEISIGIVGGVEFRRKDLYGFVDMLEQTPEQVKVYFLGKSKRESDDFKTFHSLLVEKKIEDKVVFFDHFLSQEELDAHLRNMDFLCPLIHPETPSAEQYISNQISGMFNIAFGYRIPLLIHQAYASISDLAQSAAFYRVASFGSDFNRALEQAENIKQQIAANKKWDASYQQSHFVSFISK